MIRCVARPIRREAVYFSGDNHREVTRLLGGEGSCNHSWLSDPRQGGFLHDGDEIGRRFHPGEWICRDEEGWLSIYSDRAFRANHDILSNVVPLAVRRYDGD